MSREYQRRIDPNTADAETLAKTPGLGRVLAERIIAARPFESLEDLQRVNGIGPSFLEQLRPYMDLQDMSTFESEVEVVEASAHEDEMEKESAAEPLEPAPTILEAISSTEEKPATAKGLLISEKDESAPAEEAAVAKDEPALEEEDIPSEEAIASEEVPPPQAEPSPIPKDQVVRVTRNQALLMASVSGFLALFLALGLTLVILAAINGGRLQFASPAQVNALSTQLGSLRSRAETLEGDLGGLRGRVDNLEALSGRVNTVEQTLEEVQAEVTATTSEVENLSGQVDEVAVQVETLREESARFSSFLDGLHELMGSLFPAEEGGK